jgi:hypothetical protein
MGGTLSDQHCEKGGEHSWRFKGTFIPVQILEQSPCWIIASDRIKCWASGDPDSPYANILFQLGTLSTKRSKLGKSMTFGL